LRDEAGKVAAPRAVYWRSRLERGAYRCRLRVAGLTRPKGVLRAAWPRWRCASGPIDCRCDARTVEL